VGDAGVKGLVRSAAALSMILLLSAPWARSAQPEANDKSQSLKVGTLSLHRCDAKGAWCGRLKRALDPLGVVPGTVEVYFEFYPHTGGGAARGTLVATEGGPGYPATGSSDSYLALYHPLRATRDVLLMDNRGTGRSGAVDCPELQRASVMTEDIVAACGRLLGARAPLYSTTLASDDLAAILEGLGIGRIDLYGDSYGTFFAQVFAVRHPDKLRSLVLDGAYPLGSGEYAWYPAYAPAMRAKFNFACERSEACSKIPGDSIGHIEPAVRMLREHPFAAQARDTSGILRHFTASATQLAIVMFGSAPALASIREVDAAARAFVQGDQLPLLRLMAETQNGIDSRDAAQSPEAFSAGLAAAVMCQDAPQIYDMSLDIEARQADRSRAIAKRRASAPNTYAPFTIEEYRGMPLDYGFLDECAQWPAPPASHPAGILTAGALTYSDVPTLVVSGDMDNMTPVADGAAAAANFPHGRQVVLLNSLHVNALPRARSQCGAKIVRHFVDRLEPGDVSCTKSVPEIRLVPQFARRARELDPAAAAAGNAAGTDQLRAVSAALLTAGDAMARAPEVAPGDGVGLRGGTFSATKSGDGYRLTLKNMRWTEDLAVSGTVDLPRYQGTAKAHLQLRAAQGWSGTLEAQWTEGTARARAQVHGQLDGQQVAAELPAP
jgi:pimeloyl-ACP methyl ester carboxylesterase